MMYLYHCYRALLALLIVLLFISPVDVFADDAHAGDVQILLLNSYHPGYAWSDSIAQGIRDTLKHYPGKVQLSYEYMDTKKYSDRTYLDALEDYFEVKYRKTEFDLILSSDDRALDFILAHRDGLFSGVPVVFCGVNNLDASRLLDVSKMTGVSEDVDVISNLELILALHPQTSGIHVVLDTSMTGQSVRRHIDSVLPQFRDRVSVTFHGDSTMEELERELQLIPADAVILYVFFLVDSYGTYVNADESIGRVLAVTDLPVYVAWDFAYKNGVVGGRQLSGYHQGESAASLALRVLAGESADQIPPVMNSPNRYFFDYEQLERFSIPLAALPESSILRNQPNQQQQRYNRALRYYALTTVTLLSLVGGLVGLIVVRRRSRVRLEEARRELEDKVGERTADLRDSLAELELKKLESDQRKAELESAYEQLQMNQCRMVNQEKMASVGLLSAGIAHEINNPVGFVTSNLQTMKKYFNSLCQYLSFVDDHLFPTLDATLRDDLMQQKKSGKIDFIVEDGADLISESIEGTDRIKTIVLNLKSFAHSSDEPYGPNDLHDCLRSTINIAWNEIKYKAQLHEDWGEIPDVPCYPQKLNQVFMNLLINAAHAIDDKGEIHVTTRHEGDWVRISISDTGKGIEQEHLKRLFEPFFTTKEAGKGTGLGLSIAYDIIDKHGGRIDVESTVGQGTTFTIYLPVAGIDPPN